MVCSLLVPALATRSAVASDADRVAETVEAASDVSILAGAVTSASYTPYFMTMLWLNSCSGDH